MNYREEICGGYIEKRTTSKCDSKGCENFIRMREKYI
jgi:hypothetical protein